MIKRYMYKCIAQPRTKSELPITMCVVGCRDFYWGDGYVESKQYNEAATNVDAISV